MGNCIYLFNEKRVLTYKNREHIISAGIGGKRTLPKGYVSDQANELFAKYELKCLRYSPLQIERARYGPGKRGSLDINSIDIPDVLSLEPLMESSNKICPLGFLFRSHAYVLPQIIIVFHDVPKTFDVIYIKSPYQASGNIDEAEFRLHIRKFLLSDKRNYKKIEVPYETSRSFACIGCYKKSWYISSTQSDFRIDSWATRILEKKPLDQLPPDYLGSVTPKPIFKYSRTIELDFFVPIFIHAKNCFNSLALFKGCDFVQQKIFDQFRQCILTNAGWDTVIIPESKLSHKVALWLTKNIHNHEHAVVIYTEGEDVMAFSVLYGKAWGLFKLGEGFLDKAFSNAAICDFENKKETWYDSSISFLEN